MSQFMNAVGNLIAKFIKANASEAWCVAAIAATFGALEAVITADDGKCDDYRPEVRLAMLCVFPLSSCAYVFMLAFMLGGGFEAAVLDAYDHPMTVIPLVIRVSRTAVSLALCRRGGSRWASCAPASFC